MGTQKISIVIPAYNAGMVLKKCIESLILQSYSNIEILIIDDGSKDNTLHIANTFANSDSRIKVFTKKNSGVSDTRNLGLEKVTGDYISFIDADDYVEKDFFDNFLKSKKNMDLYSSGYKKKNGNLINDLEIPTTEYVSRREMTNSILKDAAVYSFPWNKLYKTDIIKKNNIRFRTNIHYGEDLVFLFDFLKYANSFIKVKGAEYIYVQHGTSVSNKAILNEKQLRIRLNDIEAMKESLDLIPNNYIDEKNFLIKRIILEGSSYYRISKKMVVSYETSKYINKNISEFMPLYKRINNITLKEKFKVFLNLNFPKIINIIKK